MRTATALWHLSPELLLALDERLGAPVDSYVNGSQTWLTPDGPGATMLEWRLHPIAGYRCPEGCAHDELWEEVVGALGRGADVARLALGREERALSTLWDGLECFAAYGDEVEPAVLGRAATEALGRAPDRVGLVDHGAIGDAWERAQGAVSIVALLDAQLDG